MNEQLPPAPHLVDLPPVSDEIRAFAAHIDARGAALDRTPYTMRAYVYKMTTPRLEIWALDPAARNGAAAVHVFSAIWGYTAAEHLAAYLLTIAPRADWK